MEKSWMSINRLSDEYENGVEAFLNFALQNACDVNFIPCPCASCANTSKKTVNIIRAHLMKYGMDLTYKKWIWHGEGRTSTRSASLSDRVGKSDAKSTVEEPEDMIHDAYDAFEDNPSYFQTLLEYAHKPLYSGCSKFTKLSATVKLYNLKAKYSWSDTSFDDLLSLVKEMLPEENELPTSLYEAKKSISTLGLDYEKIHTCPNDCILYRKEYKEIGDCPTCGTSRWKVDRNNKSLSGVPAKVLWYFPPIPRFRRMFRTKEIAKELTWHADERISDAYLDIWIVREDIFPFCDLEPITGNCIVAYIWHLYRNMKENGIDGRFLFVNPFAISYAPKVSRDARARKLVDRLLDATPKQFVLVPCNVGEHWILTVIEPHKDRVYLMDPLAHQNRDNTWKSVVNTAMSIFNANMAKKYKKPPTWNIIKGLIQPDFKQCGFYVMRFMKEIVKGFKNDDSISMSSLEQYSKGDIDEVREDWAACVIDEIDI